MKEAQHSEDSEVLCPRCSDVFLPSEIRNHYEECTMDCSKAKKKLLAENHKEGIRYKVSSTLSLK